MAKLAGWLDKDLPMGSDRIRGLMSLPRIEVTSRKWSPEKELRAEVRVAVVKPWLLDLWEPLQTKAPSPARVQPYCCYLRTVIFYARPYVVSPWGHRWVDARGRLRVDKPGKSYIEWDRVEHVLTWDEPVEWRGERFEAGGGRVVWMGRGLGWWMKFWARRRREGV